MSEDSFRTMMLEEMRALRTTLNAILEFIGDSKRDRMAMHDTLEEHHQIFEKHHIRIEKLETGDQKKKLGH
jgi:hypothetical protein